MFKIEFNHYGYEFWAVADGWDSEAGAKAACNSLRTFVRELNVSKTRDLHAALVLMHVAYEDDPVWDAPILQALFPMQEAACRAGLECAPAENQSECRCRLIPAPAI